MQFLTSQIEWFWLQRGHYSGQGSMSLKRKAAAWDDDYLASLVPA
jgi:hypothetical protein